MPKIDVGGIGIAYDLMGKDRDPPWEDDEWNMRSVQTQSGSEGNTLFRS